MAFVNLLKNSIFRNYRKILDARFLHRTVIVSSSLMNEFEQARQKLSGLKEDPGNQTKLQLYGLFKQATVGKCNVKKPGMMDFVGKAKWEAWNALEDISQEDAKKRYISLVHQLSSSETPKQPVDHSSTTSSQDGDVVVSVKDKMHIITLNRPTRKNALKLETYNVIAEALEKSAKDDTAFTVITGSGDYFCSGNDLSNFMVDPSQYQEISKKAANVILRFISAFIDFPKPLIAIINGPAIGISVTILGLCDIVYATDKATFQTPFSSLGQSPEGCSSFTFPIMMGHAKACEMLLFNKKLTAHEAAERGLVTEVFQHSTFNQEVWTRLQQFARLPRDSLRLSKSIVRQCHREKLHEVNKREVELLMQRWLSDECMNAIMNFMQSKSKI